MEQLLNKYKEYRKKTKAYEYALYIISWDSETELPQGSFESRSIHVGELSGEKFQLDTCEDTILMIDELFEKRDQLDPVMQVEIKEMKKNLDNLKKVPKDEYVAYSMLLAQTQNIWAQAKNANDFKMFAPYLQKIVDFQKKLMKYYETPTLKGYDVLLDQYEEGSTKVMYDDFFDTLKRDLVPFVLEVTDKKLPIKHNLEERFFDVNKQKEFAKYLLDVMDFDLNHGLMKESEHPFTSGAGSQEVRITNHYYEHLLTSSIFSIIHETGHALYEQQVNPELDETFVGGGTTLAMHESQSRFYENIIGRSYGFWQTHYPKLKEIFKDELNDIDLDEFYLIINEAKRSLIRTEADELTYPIHVMIRYEIEKKLLNDEIEVNNLPQVWNKMMKDYLGVTVPSDKDGVLQDVHWSIGSIGYFPTYAYGSAISAQLYQQMLKEIDVEEIVKSGHLKEINAWLKEKVHYFGATKRPNQLLIEITNESFNPKYYISYLKEKYSKIYNL